MTYRCINGHELAYRGVRQIGIVDGQPIYECGHYACAAEAEPVPVDLSRTPEFAVEEARRKAAT